MNKLALLLILFPMLAAASSEISTMKKARELFAKEKFAQALDEYNKVDKGEDHWLEAVEEKGWTYHRQDDFAKALAQTKTLLSEPFISVVGSEPFFLQALSQLKICDYKGILDTDNLFKTSQRQRLLDIKSLAQTGDSPAIEKLIANAKTFPLTFEEVGEEAKLLPRLFYRDRQVQQDLRDIPKKKEALQKLKKRLQVLAQIEDQENFKIVQKLNLIEVETFQRVHADQDLNKNSFHKGNFAKTNEDQLVFPDDGHPWMDELDKFEMKVNACPQNIRRKM